MKRKNKIMKLGSLVVFFVILLAAVTNAEIYYVRTDGSDSNAGTANTSGYAWKTIDHAADTVSAGDVVRVQAGTYLERVSPKNNGSGVDSTITFVADGNATACGFDFRNNSYIRVIGFILEPTTGCPAGNDVIAMYETNNYLEIWNNTLRNAPGGGIKAAYIPKRTWSNSLVIGNKIHNMAAGIGTFGDHDLVAYNEIYNCYPDAIYTYGSYHRFLNNYVHDLSEEKGGHSDNFQNNSSDFGWSYNLIESHFQIGSGNSSNEHTTEIQNYQPANCSSAETCGPFIHNIFRRNVWHNVSQATIAIDHAAVGPIDNIYIYNNTTAGAQRMAAATPYGVVNYSGTFANYYLMNNIEYKAWSDDRTTGIQVYYLSASPYTVDYNLAYSPLATLTFASPWTTQSHAQSNVNPYFNAYASKDFTIASNSGAKGTGGALTTTSGSGTGTKFKVAPNGGGFFRGSDSSNLSQYDGNLVPGDTITVGSNTLTVAGVAGDYITVTQSFTWSDGQNVYFGSSSSPDIGAYPYMASGYSLSGTYSKAGSTVTVTPSSSDLVRFVVCYEDGIPVCVANSRPYTCTVGSGSLDVRIYPLYASQTLDVSATATAETPISPPTKVRIEK